MLILPSRWRQQPQQPVRVDWSNPLARGLAFVSVGGSHYEASSGRIAANKINLVSGADGRSYRGDGTNELNWGSQFGLDAVSKNISVFARGALTANTVAGIPICGTRSTGGFGFLLDSNAGGDSVPLNFILWGVAGQASTTNADFFNGSYGQYFSIAATHQPNTTAGLNFYFRGKPLGAAVNTGVPAASSANLAILGRGDGTYLPTTYDLSIVALWTRILSAAEIAALDANPWQLFRAPPRRIYVSLPAGGTTVALIGQAMTSVQGTLGVAIDKSLVGQSISFTQGSFIPVVSIPLSGQVVTVSQGVLTPVFGVTIPLVGQNVSLSMGSLSTSTSVSMSGNIVTVTPGSFIVDQSQALTGNSVASSLGTISVTLGSNLSGQGVAISQGSLGPSITASIVGQTLIVSLGTLTPLIPGISTTTRIIWG